MESTEIWKLKRKGDGHQHGRKSGIPEIGFPIAWKLT